MWGDNFYILSSLPAMGELGQPPPIGAGELLERVSPFPEASIILETLFLGHDLVLREAFLSGEISDLEDLAVLTAQQARGESPLPEFLISESAPHRIPVDGTWEAYFRYADSVGEKTNCAFLRKWVRFEVTLRNSLAVARAKALDLEPTDYLVAPELSERDLDLRGLVAEWSSAPTPLAGHMIVERTRWEWAKNNDRWFSFQNDELAAYGLKLLLLKRWLRLSRGQSGKEPQKEEK